MTDYEKVEQSISNLQSALLEDSLNPSPSYSVGGQSVDRNSWRESILRQIKELYNLLSIISPSEFRQQIY